MIRGTVNISEASMARKTCFKCGEVKPLSAFYKHPQMKDGHVNKCTECNKNDVRKNREAKVEHYREYDRSRGNRQSREYRDKDKALWPRAYMARGAVARAIRAKKLFRLPCERCGNLNTHGHHDDYAKPLNVRWLCAAHHSQWHKKHGQAKNAA